jgi:hypothetical protein
MPTGGRSSRPELGLVMDRNKATGPHRGPGAIATLADHLPVGAHRLLTPLARRAAPWLFDVVITTITVPSRPMALHGAVLDEVYPLVPVVAGHTLSIALATHRDHVHITIQGHTTGEVTRLAELFPTALAALTPVGSRTAPPPSPLPRVDLPTARACTTTLTASTPPYERTRRGRTDNMADQADATITIDAAPG